MLLLTRKLFFKSIQVLKKTRPGVLYCDWAGLFQIWTCVSAIKTNQNPGPVSLPVSADRFNPRLLFSYFLHSNLKKLGTPKYSETADIYPQLELPQKLRDRLLQFLYSFSRIQSGRKQIESVHSPTEIARTGLFNPIGLAILKYQSGLFQPALVFTAL